ncbi:MAG TPA: GDSL-type esterase/lipase family protein [Streptosporangiaceae bacterium]
MSRFGPSRRRFLAATGVAGLAGPAVTGLRTGVRSLMPSSQNPAAAVPIASQQSRSLSPWFAGLSNRLSATCSVVCLGDSITEGVHASGPPSTGFENRWLARLRDVLRSRYPTQGLTGGGRGFIGATSSGEGSFAWPAALAGSPITAATGGPKAKFVQLGGAGQSITFALAGDSADIMWMQAAFGGTFSWAVDGGTATRVSTNGSSTVDGRITHIPLGSPGPHTLVLSWVSGNGNIDGVVEYNGDYGRGISVHDAGHYGWQTSSWVNALNNGAVSGPAAAIAALSPSAIIITLGSNDQYTGVDPATFQSRLQAIIASLRARLANPYPAIVLNMLPARVSQSGYTFPWSQYVAAAYNVAAADTAGPGGMSVVSVMDFTVIPAMPGADTDAYGFWQSGDLVHPSNRGHQMIADCLTAFLSES